MKNVSDGELMKAIAQGNTPAFRELFVRHSGLVLGYSVRLLRNTQLAEDASQETWIRVVRGAPQYQDRNLFRSWLLQIARRQCLTLLQHRSHNEVPLEAEHESKMLSRESLEDLISQYELLTQAKRLIDGLPDQQRAALVIWLTEDISYEDLAHELGLSIASVKSLLFRARRSLESGLKGGT